MVSYRYALVDESAGTYLGDLPLSVTSPFSRVLNGCGTLTGTIPLEHPMAAWNVIQRDRAITVIRNESEIVWNGPIVGLDASFSSPEVTVTAREASWYLQKRVLEVNKTYTGVDLYDIFRDLIDNITTKVSDGTDGMGAAGQDINAAIPGFFVDPGAGALSGVTVDRTYSGAARHLISDIVAELVNDPTTGLDYCMVYSAGGGGVLETPNRALTLGSPALGTTNDYPITEHTLFDFRKTQDRERAANRVHCVGGGYTYTAQNATSVVPPRSDILIEGVVDKSDSVDPAVIRNYARDARRRMIPPIIPMEMTYVDSSDLPFGFAELGDHLTLDIGGTTVLHSLGGIRVVEIQIMPESAASPELITLVGDVSLDDLGT